MGTWFQIPQGPRLSALLLLNWLFPCICSVDLFSDFVRNKDIKNTLLWTAYFIATQCLVWSPLGWILYLQTSSKIESETHSVLH